ncbi:hypothetical protein MASR2M44_21410 [Bacteroidota bacterium]
MFTKEQEKLLDNFADKSDQLFDLGVISTDSFTGEIGEYIVCKHFNLKKSNRVTQAVDGVSATGEKYQVKAKVVSKNNFSYNLKDLPTDLFDILTIVYFDNLYTPLKIVVIPSKKIKKGEVRISSSTISNFENIDGAKIKIPAKVKTAIKEFSEAYNSLEKAEIIRSRRIVGDIGEFYACRKLNLIQSENRNEKGIDARHQNGLTFEIKTRRVYESGRRVSETRRLNNLVGKSADYLIVVTLDRSFKCSGMWLIPMKNLTNPKSANLKIVNTTIGTLNVIPSKISWLVSGEKFKGFGSKKKAPTKSTKPKSPTKRVVAKREITKKNTAKTIKQPKILAQPRPTFDNNNYNNFGCAGCFSWIIIFIVLLMLIGYLTDGK